MRSTDKSKIDFILIDSPIRGRKEYGRGSDWVAQLYERNQPIYDYVKRSYLKEKMEFPAEAVSAESDTQFLNNKITSLGSNQATFFFVITFPILILGYLDFAAKFGFTTKDDLKTNPRYLKQKNPKLISITAEKALDLKLVRRVKLVLEPVNPQKIHPEYKTSHEIEFFFKESLLYRQVQSELLNCVIPIPLNDKDSISYRVTKVTQIRKRKVA